MIHPLTYVLQPDPPSNLRVPLKNTVVDLFASQVTARPFSIALEVDGKTFTYRTLDNSADRVARLLRSQGIGCGDVVAICLKRTENLIIAILGVLKAGAAYLPLSPADPTLRLGQVIAHADARCVLTDAHSDANLSQGAAQIIRVDERPIKGTDEELAVFPGEDSLYQPTVNDLAYVIYTSGTTGTPKGVAIGHGALANITVDVARRVGFVEGASWLAVTTVCFDIAALELLVPLCYGGRIILASEDQARIGRVLAAILRRKQPAVMQATPITWKILIESGWAGSKGLTVLCGGDRLDRDLASRLVDRCGAVWNMYGPTETTIWSTADKLSPGDDQVTIGRPVSNTHVYIVDDNATLKPAGEVGEICIGGAGLALYYVKDAGLTRQKFIDLSIDGVSVPAYRTGDLGRWNEQGKIEFFGRIDQQVKINGFRIELPEIEQVIRSYPGVLDVAVLGVSGGGGVHQKRLYAFVVSEGETLSTSTDLVAHMQRHLPRYMIPEKFWVLPQLPVTKNGKRDASALEAISKVQPELPR